MNIIIVAGLLVATLVCQSSGAAMIPEHPQTAFCKADFVARVKILGKIKKDDDPPTAEATPTTYGDGSTDASQLSTLEPSTEDPTKLVVMKSSLPQNFQKPSDTPPLDYESKNGSLLGSILGRHKRSVGLRGVPPPGGDLYYRPIGGKHRDKGMMYYDVLIKKVFKGEDKVRKTRGTFVDAANPSRVFAKIYFSSHHGQDLEPGVAYMLSGKIMDNDLILPSRGCWYDKWHTLSGEEIHGLHGKYAENCDCTIKFCIPGPHCKMRQSFKHPWCDWELRNIKEPGRDCGAKHNICTKQHGECQWTTGHGYHSCINPSGLFP